mgnify:FL=1
MKTRITHIVVDALILVKNIDIVRLDHFSREFLLRRRSLQLIILLIAIICARDLPPLEGSHLIFIIRHGSTISNGSTRKQQFGPIGDKGAPFLSFFILCVYEFSVIANCSRKQSQAALFL